MPGRSVVVVLCGGPLERLDGANCGDEVHDGEGEDVEDVEG